MVIPNLNQYYGSEISPIQENTDETYPLDAEVDYVASFLNSRLLEHILTLVQADVDRNDQLIRQFDEIIDICRDDDETLSPVPEAGDLLCNQCETVLLQIEYAVNDEPVCEACFNEVFASINSTTNT